MTSCRVDRSRSRCSLSRETTGISSPASPASRSTASGKDRPSVRMTKSKMLPLLPEEKSNQAIFWSLTKKDGLFSALKGDSPFHSRPAFTSLTRRRTTSETGSRALISSRKEGVKRIAVRRGPVVHTQCRRFGTDRKRIIPLMPAIHRLSSRPACAEDLARAWRRSRFPAKDFCRWRWRPLTPPANPSPRRWPWRSPSGPRISPSARRPPCPCP